MSINSENTALVLEGGGLRGVFTCGVLDAFMDNGVKFPFAIGVSAGACNIIYDRYEKENIINSSVDADGCIVHKCSEELSIINSIRGKTAKRTGIKQRWNKEYHR